MRLIKSYISDYGMTFVVKAFSIFGSFLLVAVIARLGSSEVLGDFSIAMGLSMALVTVSRFGSDNATLRFASVAWDQSSGGLFRGIQLQGIKLILSISLVLGICLFINADIVAEQVFRRPDMQGVFKEVAVFTPVFSLVFLQSAWLKSIRFPSVALLFEMGSISILASGIIIFAWSLGMELGAQVLMRILALSALVSILCGQIKIQTIYRKKFEALKTDLNNKIQYEETFYRVLPDYALGSVLGFISQWGIILLLGMSASSEDVGLFTLLLKLALCVNVMLGVINTVVIPKFSSLYASNNMTVLASTVQSASIALTAFAFPIALTFMIFPSFFLGIFGNEFERGSTLLRFLVAAQFFNVCTGSVGVLLYMTGHQKIMRNMVLIAACVGLTVAIVFIPKYNVSAAVAATCSILLIQNALAVVMVKRKLGIDTLPSLGLLIRNESDDK